MSLTPLAVADLVLVAPARFEDARGDLEVVITPALGAPAPACCAAFTPSGACPRASW